MFAASHETGSDRAGGALPSAHVPRAAAAPRLSSFTSLRGAPHRPDPSTTERAFEVNHIGTNHIVVEHAVRQVGYLRWYITIGTPTLGALKAIPTVSTLAAMIGNIST